MAKRHRSTKVYSILSSVITQSFSLKALVLLTSVEISWSTRFLTIFTIEMNWNEKEPLLKCTDLNRKLVNKIVSEGIKRRGIVILSENLNLVISYDDTKYRWGLISFGQYISNMILN